MRFAAVDVDVVVDDEQKTDEWILCVFGTPLDCPSPFMYGWAKLKDGHGVCTTWVRIKDKCSALPKRTQLTLRLFKPWDVAEGRSAHTAPAYSCVGFGHYVVAADIRNGGSQEAAVVLTDSQNGEQGGSRFALRMTTTCRLADFELTRPRAGPQALFSAIISPAAPSFQSWSADSLPEGSSFPDPTASDRLTAVQGSGFEMNEQSAIDGHTLWGLKAVEHLGCSEIVTSFLRYSAVSAFDPATFVQSSDGSRRPIGVPVWIQVLRPTRKFTLANAQYIDHAVRCALAIAGSKEAEFKASPAEHPEVLAQVLQWYALNHHYKDDTTSSGKITEEMSNPQIFNAGAKITADCEDTSAAMHDMAASLFYLGLRFINSRDDGEWSESEFIRPLCQLASMYVPFTHDCVVSSASAARSRSQASAFAFDGDDETQEDDTSEKTPGGQTGRKSFVDPWIRSGIQSRPRSKNGAPKSVAQSGARIGREDGSYLHNIVRLYPVVMLSEVLKKSENASSLLQLLGREADAPRRKLVDFLTKLISDHPLLQQRKRIDLPVLHLESTDRCMGSQRTREPLFTEFALDSVAQSMDRYRFLMDLNSQRARDFYDVILRSYSSVAFLETGQHLFCVLN